MRLPRILHVVDRTSGGVPVAVQTYLDNSPPGVSHIVITPFENGEPPKHWIGHNCDLVDLGMGHLARIKRLRLTIKALRPSAVHAHSSFSGLYARLSTSSQRTQPVIYSPHCFAFERTDQSRLLRFVYRSIERLLARNTHVVAACSRREAEIALNSLPRLSGRAVAIPNIRSIYPANATAWPGGQLVVGMIGRISPQKSPSTYVDLVERLRAAQPQVRGLWLGDGPPAERNKLKDRGVEISGWLSPAKLREQLISCDLYIHSAAWEGFPIAVLDAHAAGLPILVRQIGAFADVPRRLTVEEGFETMSIALSSPDSFNAWAAENRSHWEQFLSENTPEVQQHMLRQVWCHDV